MIFDEGVKNLDIFDIGLTKLTVLFGTLFLVSIFTGFASWVVETNEWYFFAAFIVFMIRPMYKFFMKKKAVM
jgi:uncharacterized protein YggT (Ycf19 family)